MPRPANPVDVFHAIADESRRDILDLLRDRESAVGALVERLCLPQPQVSKHLKVLRDVDLVRCRVAGRQRVYRVHAPALHPLRDWLATYSQAMNDRLDRLDDVVAEMQRAAVEPEDRSGQKNPTEPTDDNQED